MTKATHSDTADLLELALGAARLAGGMLLADRPADLGVAATKSSPTDVVTEMDTAAEKLIVDYLRARRPHDGFLGEEGGGEPGESGIRWVIDPIDGTVNYLYDLPAWCVSIAAEDARGAVVGVVEVPVLRETFHAVRGGGAFRGGVPVRGNAAVPMREAMVATGFGYTVERRRRQAEVVRRILPEVRDIRRYGSAAIDLCAVACGRVDAYYERGLNAWDVAAGALIAREAGARVEEVRAQADGSRLTLAAAPELYEELAGVLVGLEA
ncbi:inositol monophosphatase [Yinghuangia sp. ASG 101]|uniref:inositol monophosphatase family protein n=1 Tax=Yinghuangia sp. ASG 101 TaxID=2896848 RepID=UPI001E378974|nr:inositol monophosphatase family protein [Yinghuangia sp. ASG 101]UGQ13863.1 inositol monophosphatase [Yinghuangia sp. ASG 101]